MIKIGDIEIADFPLILAPMEDISDPPFRKICKENGADLLYTEFISTEGLIRDAQKSLQKLDILENERPIGIQIFGANEDSMVESVKIIERVKPDFIDINFGCPVKKVVSKGAGAGILKDIPKMIKLTKAVVNCTNIPITVKTRLGWDDNSIKVVEVAEKLQDVGIKAIAIHGRTRKQMYKGDADWEQIYKVKNNSRMHIPIFANGDINTPEKVKIIKEKYGFDGAMIGRAAIGNPWFFNTAKKYLETGEITEIEFITKVETVKKHLRHSIEWKGEKLGIFEMRKHYTNYFKGIRDFKNTRIKLVTAKTELDILEILNNYICNL